MLFFNILVWSGSFLKNLIVRLIESLPSSHHCVLLAANANDLGSILGSISIKRDITKVLENRLIKQNTVLG